MKIQTYINIFLIDIKVVGHNIVTLGFVRIATTKHFDTHFDTEAYINLYNICLAKLAFWLVSQLTKPKNKCLLRLTKLILLQLQPRFKDNQP